MNKIVLPLMLMMGFFLMLSCSKSSTSGYSMSAIVNGAAFSGSNCYAQKSGTTLTINGGNFSGTVLNVYPIITLTVYNYNGATGTYTFGANLGGGVLDSSATSNAIVSKSGSLTITSVSPSIAGTFTFTANDGTTLTNGTFNALLN
jgi:hypothetical protein